MSLIERLRHAWTSRIEPGLYRGTRAALLPTDVVLSLLAKRSYPIFRAWQRYAAATNHYFDRGRPPHLSQPDGVLVEQLRQHGFVVTPSGYPAAEIRAARDWVVDRAERARQRVGESREIARYEENGLVAEVMPVDGRVRLHFSPDALVAADVPSVIRDFADTRFCRELTAAYFDTGVDDMRCRVPYYVAEVVTPNERLETWHIDCLRATVKCFLLLDDVGEAQAPLRYIDRSHLVDDERLRLFYEIARGGLGAAYFGDDDATAYDGGALHLTAPAGSLLAFDSRGIHAGSFCRSGVRVTLVNGYRPPQARRLSPRLFRDLVRTPYPWERATAATRRDEQSPVTSSGAAVRSRAGCPNLGGQRCSPREG